MQFPPVFIVQSQGNFSALLILGSFTVLISLGAMLYQLNNFEGLIWLLIVTGGVIIFAALQVWLAPEPFKSKPRTYWQIGGRVCGLTSLLVVVGVFAFVLALIFYKLDVNSPYRVQLDKLDETSPRIRIHTFDNGLKLYYSKSLYKRNEISLSVRVHVGSLDEHPNQRGLATLAEFVAANQASNDVWSKFEMLGARIESRTSPRCTLFKVRNVPYSQEHFRMILVLLKDMTLYQKPTKSSLEVEKRVFASETKLLNSSQRMLSRQLYCNHYGHSSTVCQSISGEYDDMRLKDVERFFEQWYHPGRMDLYLSTGLQADDVVKIIADIWGNATRATETQPSVRQQVAAPNPKEPFSIQSLKGVDGFQLHLLVSLEYQAGMLHSTKGHLRRRYQNIFSVVLLNQFLERVAAYEDSKSELASHVELRTKVQESYELNQTVHSLALLITGHPEKGPWRRCLEALLIELRRLAEVGPNDEILRQLMQKDKMILEARRAFSGLLSGANLVDRMLGSRDPTFVYQDADQEFSSSSQFLNPGFLNVASTYVQSEAQFLWKHLVELVNNSQPFRMSPYDQMRSGTSSLIIWTHPTESSKKAPGTEADYATDTSGRNATENSNTTDQDGDFDALEGDKTSNKVSRENNRSTSPSDRSFHYQTERRLIEKKLGQDSYVSKKDIILLLDKVLDAVLVSRSPHVVISLEEALLEGEKYTQQPWERSSERFRGESEQFKDHLDSIFDDEKQLAVDGLPTSGSLVDLGRLYPPPESIVLPIRPTIPKFAGDHVDASDPYYPRGSLQLLDHFPKTGVKRYMLANGLRVNLKPRLSGDHELPCDPEGEVVLEVVALGGRATQPPHLKGACEMVNLNVPSGFRVAYWPRTNASFTINKQDKVQTLEEWTRRESEAESILEEVYFDAHTVRHYLGKSHSVSFECEKEHLLLRKKLHVKCVNYPKVFLTLLNATSLSMAPQICLHVR